jgi:hypothetical protein
MPAAPKKGKPAKGYPQPKLTGPTVKPKAGMPNRMGAGKGAPKPGMSK